MLAQVKGTSASATWAQFLYCSLPPKSLSTPLPTLIFKVSPSFEAAGSGGGGVGRLQKEGERKTLLHKQEPVCHTDWQSKVFFSICSYHSKASSRKVAAYDHFLNVMIAAVIYTVAWMREALKLLLHVSSDGIHSSKLLSTSS